MFNQPLKPENHRGQNGEAAGPLFDMGVYPLNAVRNLFGAEPIQVSAFGTKHPGVSFILYISHKLYLILSPKILNAIIVWIFWRLL